ncbi:MAG: rRNA maturation RNase YbeY [Candidatus Omnitrophica bacterium]|nr:rRNA maturation RNase YbeY [Candidatus Omnitrophota bacterium]
MAVVIRNTQSRYKVPARQLRQVAASVLAEYGKSETELCIVLVDNKEIVRLNRAYLHESSPTDVIAFPQGAPPRGAAVELLGDVVISVEEAAAQAQIRQIPFFREVALYAIHGILHLLGFDDTTQAASREMKALQRVLLEKFYDSKNQK